MSTAIATGAVPAEELLGRRRWVRVAASKSSAAGAAQVASGALANHPFLEPHSAGLKQFLVWDVDHEDGWLRAWSLAPDMEPTAVIEHGGRAQVLVRIEAIATGPRARSAPQEWLRAVEQAGADLLDADPAFSGVRCRSPWWTGPDPGDGVEVTVTWGRSAAARRPRSLAEVMAGLEAARTRLEDGPGRIWAEAPDPADLGGRRRPALLERAIAARRRGGHGAGVETPDTGTIPAGARNVGLFWGVALPMAHRGCSADEIEAALSAENRVRCSPPLGAAEIAGIARSAVRQAARHPDTGAGFTPAERAVLARWGRRGGQARTPAKAAAAAAAAERGRDAQTTARIDRAGMITQMTAAGLSARQIAADLGVSISTVRRARAAGRAEQGAPEGGVSSVKPQVSGPHPAASRLEVPQGPPTSTSGVGLCALGREKPAPTSPEEAPMTTHRSADSPARPAPLRTRHAGRHGAIRRRARGGLPLGFEIAPVVGEETDQPTWVVLRGGRDRPVAFLERLPGRPRWIATLPEIWASQTDPAERAAHALVTAPSRARAAAAAIEALGVTPPSALHPSLPAAVREEIIIPLAETQGVPRNQVPLLWDLDALADLMIDEIGVGDRRRWCLSEEVEWATAIRRWRRS